MAGVLAAFDCETSVDEWESFSFQPSEVFHVARYDGGERRNGLFCNGDPLNYFDPTGCCPEGSNSNGGGGKPDWWQNYVNTGQLPGQNGTNPADPNGPGPNGLASYSNAMVYRAMLRGAQGMNTADFQELATELGWNGFQSNLAPFQQDYYGATAANLLQRQAQGKDTSAQWSTVLGEVPGVIVDGAGTLYGSSAFDSRQSWLNGMNGAGLQAGATVTVSLLEKYLNGSGGRWGGTPTRLLNDAAGTSLESQGVNVTNGAGRGPEEYIPGEGPGTTGSTFVDIKGVDANGNVVRVQTIDTMADGVTPTPGEAAAAARIRTAFPNDTLIMIPKDKGPGP